MCRSCGALEPGGVKPPQEILDYWDIARFDRRQSVVPVSRPPAPGNGLISKRCNWPSCSLSWSASMTGPADWNTPKPLRPKSVTNVSGMNRYPSARHVGQHDKVLLNAILQKRDDITFGLDEGGENLA